MAREIVCRKCDATGSLDERKKPSNKQIPIHRQHSSQSDIARFTTQYEQNILLSRSMLIYKILNAIKCFAML